MPGSGFPSTPFDWSLAPAAGIRGGAPMLALPAHGGAVPGSRPKGKILGRDNPQSFYRSLSLLADGRVLAGHRGKNRKSLGGLQIRGGEELGVQASLEGAAPPYSLHENGSRLLSAGPFFGFNESSLRLADLTRLELLDTLPLRRPFAWLPGEGEQLLAHAPFYFDKYQVASEVLRKHPFLQKLLSRPRLELLHIDLGRKEGRPLIQGGLCPAYEHFRYLAISPDGAIAYACTYHTLFAISVARGEVLWTRAVAYGSRSIMEALAPSPDGRLLALCGNSLQANMPDLWVLDASSGAPVLSLHVEQRLSSCGFAPRGGRALAWHPAGWLAVGTEGGCVVHLTLDGQLRAYKAATRGVYALLFLNAGRTLLVAGEEKHLREWALLEDEAPPTDET